MQLGFSFALLLGSTLLALTAPGGVDALPTKRTPGLTVPVQRLHGPRDDIHPSLNLQQHINRATRRLARMTGRAEPTDEQLHAALVRRVLAVEGERGLAARFNRHGVPKPHQLAARYNREGVPSYVLPGGGSAAAAATAQSQSFALATNTNDTNTNASVPPVTPAGAPAAPNSLGLDIEANDVGYIATVQIGTPPRGFRMLVDSGSLQTWVGGENCTSTGGDCGNHTFLGPASSSSFNLTALNFTEQYSSGQVSGLLAGDDVTVAGLALKNYTIGVASQESVDFASSAVPLDGVMGLGQSNQGSSGALPVIPLALAQQGATRKAVVSFKIPRLADNNDGEITFGGTDASKFDAASLVTFANTNGDGFWGAPLDAVSVDGKSVGNGTSRSAIFDTGTTLMLAPQQDADAIHAQIPGAQSDGQGGYTVPCNLTNSVALTFDGRSFAIDPRDIAFAPQLNDSSTCTSGIVGGAQSTAEWLVGDTFLRNVYFSFDLGQNNIQMATLS